jgi:hypothetical protein
VAGASETPQAIAGARDHRDRCFRLPVPHANPPSRARRNTVATLQQQPPSDNGTGGNILPATGPTSSGRTRRRRCQGRLPQGVPVACGQTNLLLEAAPARRFYPPGPHRDGQALRRGLQRWAHADHALASRGLPLRPPPPISCGHRLVPVWIWVVAYSMRNI